MGNVVVSHADYILPGDRLKVIKVTLRVTLNASAYEREFHESLTLAEHRWGLKRDIEDLLAYGTPWVEGIVSDIEVE